MILRIDSCLDIRSGGQMSTVTLPKGLSYRLLINNITASISTRVIYCNSRFNGFRKERGFLSVNGIVFHVEIISVKYAIGKPLPLIFRIWSIDRMIGNEFLVGHNVINFRKNILNMINDTTSVLLNKVICVYGENFSGHYIPPDMLTAFICDINKPSIIPNLTCSEFNIINNHIGIGPTDFDQLLTMLVQFAFGYIFSSKDICELIGILDGYIKPTYIGDYKHNNTFNDELSDNSTISNEREYAALLILLRIPFDSFRVRIHMSPCDVQLLSADSMAGPSLPFRQITDDLLELFYEFIALFFHVDYANDTTNYIDIVGIHCHKVDYIDINRTNDEYVSITIYSGELIYMKEFDLLMISLISPVISA